MQTFDELTYEQLLDFCSRYDPPAFQPPASYFQLYGIQRRNPKLEPRIVVHQLFFHDQTNTAKYKVTLGHFDVTLNILFRSTATPR